MVNDLERFISRWGGARWGDGEGRNGEKERWTSDQCSIMSGLYHWLILHIDASGEEFEGCGVWGREAIK